MRSLKKRRTDGAGDQRPDDAAAERAQNPFSRPTARQSPRPPVHKPFELTREFVGRLLSFDAAERSKTLGIATFLFGVGGYSISLWGAVSAEPLVSRIVSSIAAGAFIAVLFVTGHDACHGSLTPLRALNKWIGRLALLPSLHPYSAWIYSHNVLHHGWTNLKGYDPVYAPLTLDEYLAAPRRRRFLERLHRSIAGVGLLYFNTIWIPYEAFPSKEKRRQIARYGDYSFDRALVYLFLAALIGIVISFSASASEAILNVALAVILPFATWNWLIGFVTFLHHTHPSIEWKDDRAEWTFADSQIRSAAHVIFPEALDLFFLRIMHHTGHHAAPEVPYYRLESRQALLDDHTTTYRLSWKELRDVFSTCQLYDYRRKQWLRFPGEDQEPGAEPRSRSGAEEIDLERDRAERSKNAVGL